MGAGERKTGSSHQCQTEPHLRTRHTTGRIGGQQASMLEKASLAGLRPGQGEPGLRERGTRGQMLWALETTARPSDSARTQSKLAAEPRIRMQLHQSVRQRDTALDTAGRTRQGSHTAVTASPGSRAEGSSRPPAQHLKLRFVWQFLQQELIPCRGFARARTAPPAAGDPPARKQQKQFIDCKSNKFSLQ